MRRKKRNLGFLILSFLSLATLFFLIINYSPSFNISLFNLNISIVFLFLSFVFLFFYSFFSFLLSNKRRGALIGLFMVAYLILRLNQLTNLFFAILLVILFGSLELLFAKRK